MGVQLPDDGHHVDDVTDPAEDPVSQQRVETGPHGHGQILSVAEDGKRQAHQAVDHPGMDCCKRVILKLLSSANECYFSRFYSTPLDLREKLVATFFLLKLSFLLNQVIMQY